MTDVELIAAVNAVISKTLNNKFFQNIIDSETQNQAILLAAGDVFTRLNGANQEKMTATTGPVISAIAEQAVFVMKNLEEQTDGKTVTGEGVEGLSISYAMLNAADGTLAPRAVAYIEQAKRQMRVNAAGAFRFGRG